VWYLGDVFSKTEKRIIMLAVVVAIISFVGLFVHTFIGDETIIPKEHGVFSEVYFGDIKSLNPIFARQDSIEDDITSLMFSALLKRDPDTNEYIPDIASVWAMNTQADEFTFVIRDDVLWHDGVKLSIDDIDFTVSIFKDKSFITRYSNIFDNVKLEKRGDNKVIFKLDRPDALFVDNMTFPRIF